VYDPAQSLTSQLLEWLAARPRCYADVMEVWRTSCPRLPVWEAAVEQGWVQVEHRPGVPMGSCAVVLTSVGREHLYQAMPGRPTPGS
jgi:D-3-phosphoglycerate dehydrogenase / 2-oxoglutarate reductase